MDSFVIQLAERFRSAGRTVAFVKANTWEVILSGTHLVPQTGHSSPQLAQALRVKHEDRRPNHLE